MAELLHNRHRTYVDCPLVTFRRITNDANNNLLRTWSVYAEASKTAKYAKLEIPNHLRKYFELISSQLSRFPTETLQSGLA